MLTNVSRNPMQICMVNAVPTYWDGLNSEIAAENCAESAITLNPHTNMIGASSHNGASTSSATAIAALPLTAIAPAAVTDRPTRSATQPPATAPPPPTAITANANPAANSGSPPSRATTCARNSGIQAHIAYSSH